LPLRLSLVKLNGEARGETSLIWLSEILRIAMLNKEAKGEISLIWFPSRLRVTRAKNVQGAGIWLI